MTPAEVLDRVMSSVDDDEAWGALQDAIAQLARSTSSVVPAFRDQATDAVEFKVMEMLLSGCFVPEHSATALVRKMLTNQSIDLYRKHKVRQRFQERERKVELALQENAPVESSVGEALDRQTHKQLLEQVYQRAWSNRQARHRPSLEVSMQLARQKAAQRLTFPELATAESGIAPDEPGHKSVVFRLQKSHQRLRDALLKAVDDLARTGDMTPMEVAGAHEAIHLEVSCPQQSDQDVDPSTEET